MEKSTCILTKFEQQCILREVLMIVYIQINNNLVMNFDLLGLEQPIQINNFNSISQQQQINQLRLELVPNYKNLNQGIRNRVDDLLKTLINTNNKKIIQNYSRTISFQQTPLLRSHIWKILLDSLPIESIKWKQKKQQNYQIYLKLLEGQSHFDQPDLLQINQNIFNQQLWNQIMLDSRRTHSMMNFFQSQVSQIKIYSSKPTRHYDILTRILYIWAKTNAGVKYVQGMNQILAPLYYLEFQLIKKQSQSEVFFMFSSLITSLIDMHIKDMDKSQQGIGGRMNTLNKYLKAVDYQLWSKLQQQGVNPQFYSFRWLALLLSQQFGLIETMRIWDILLTYQNTKRFKYLYCLCLAIIRLRKKQIMQQQFTHILPKLQKLKDLDVGQILELAGKYYEKLVKVDIDKLLIRQEQIRNQKSKKQQQKKQSLYKKTESIFKNLVIKQKKPKQQ